MESTGFNRDNLFKVRLLKIIGKTLYQMMGDVGFTKIRVSRIIGDRCFAIGRRMTHVDFMRGGISAKVR